MDEGKVIAGGEVKEFTIHNVGLIISVNGKITKKHDKTCSVEGEDEEPEVKICND